VGGHWGSDRFGRISGANRRLLNTAALALAFGCCDVAGCARVRKDDTKPFIVYANQLVTKVIGTSFIIDAFL